MTFGFSKEQFFVLCELVINPFKDHGFEVYIFGSRVTGKFHPYSDVDLLYVKPPNAESVNLDISKIKEAIEDSAFPFTVDLVDASDLAASYRANVDDQKIKL